MSAGRRIFVTGVSGCVGSALAQALHQREYEVIGLTRSRDRAKHLPIRTLEGDLGDVAAFAEEVERADAIVHCASARSFERDAALSIDVAGTGALLDRWRRGPFVFISSQTVYGKPDRVLAETSPLQPQGWYDLAKVCNEFQLFEHARLQARRGVALRWPLFFGAGHGKRNDQFLPELWDALREGVEFLWENEQAMALSGSVFIGPEDAGAAVAAAVERADTGAFNVSSGFCSWLALLETLAELAQTQLRVKISPGFTSQPGQYRLPQSRSEYSTHKFSRATDFQPRERLRPLLENFVNAELSR